MACDVQAQHCEFLLNGDGTKNSRFIVIDGEVFFYTSEDNARKILKQSNDLDALKSKNGLLNEKLRLKDETIRIKDLQIAASQDAYEMMKFLAEHAAQTNSGTESWYETKQVAVATTFLFTAMAFGYWSFTVKNLSGGQP